MDGSADSANIDDELFLVTWCSTDGHGQIVCTNMSYLCVARPKKVNGQGLLIVLQLVLTVLEYKILVLNIASFWLELV